MQTVYESGSQETSDLLLDRTLIVEVVSDGRKMATVEEAFITRSFKADGKPTIHGRAAVACLLFLICITVLEAALCLHLYRYY